jgi:DNA-binding NtrC family response regulator
MTISTCILVIDDEEVMRDSCRKTLSLDHYDIELAEDGIEGLNILKKRSFDIVILDLKIPGLGGIEILKQIKEYDPEISVIVMTGYATIHSAVEAMKNGAYDFIEKPFTPEKLRTIVQRAVEKRKLTFENLYLQRELENAVESDPIIGQSKEMCQVIELIKKVGPSDSTVLITGESGTGKELIARALHRYSHRSSKPFITIDCGSLVENLFESELFGHVKGSFTGATATKHGRLELANGGTVFLDEIGNIGIGIQAKFLRAIQEREIAKVGNNQIIKIDIRIIAATNQNLLQSVKDGSFREDLFYRLSVVPIHLPPLRQRKEDIPLLVHYFLQKYNKKRKKTISGISDQAMKALINYEWPGNVRELENAIERAVVLTDHEHIEPDDLYYYGLYAESEIIADKALDTVEMKHIEKILKLYGGHKLKTSKALGIDRKTLRRKIRKFGLDS